MMLNALMIQTVFQLHAAIQKNAFQENRRRIVQQRYAQWNALQAQWTAARAPASALITNARQSLNKMKAIVVSGTPGTGKTGISKLISRKLEYKYVDVKKLIKKNKLSDGYDNEKKCEIVDAKKLSRFLVKFIKKSNQNLIIDSHLAHYLPKKYVDMCIITKCNLKELKKRLEKRKYSREKIRENLDSEIFEICVNEAAEKGHSVIILDTTGKTPSKVLDKDTMEILQHI
jgi:adenylate kinase